MKPPVANKAPIYLDANATTQPLEAVVSAVADCMRGAYGNPSSAHWLGDQSRSALEVARDHVASLFPGVYSEGVFFNSGGTEGNNTVFNFSTSVPELTIITSTVEHASILRPVESLARRGINAVFLPVSSDGLVSPDDVAKAVRQARGEIVLSIQWANSETGVLQPIGDLVQAALAERSDILVHSDVAQAVGRVRLNLESAAVDVATFSSHKLHGPGGVGALVLRDPDMARLRPLILGGGQEQGLRSGTHNVAGAVGLGIAAHARATEMDQITHQLSQMRDAFEASLADALPRQITVNGASAPRVPNTSSIRFHGVEGMTLVALLDAAGIACSLGSACSAAKPEPSHVLIAMGLPEREAFSSVRFSFSILNTMEEAIRAARIVTEVYRGII